MQLYTAYKYQVKLNHFSLTDIFQARYQQWRANMRRLLMLLTVCSVVFSSLGKAEPSVEVGVYYETLCPDSMRFVTKQLYPTWQVLSSHLQVKLVAYGKASYWNSSGDWHFQCQHGTDECYGNKVHACALKYLNFSTAMEFTYCSMDQPYPPTAGQHCANKNNINYDPIRACADGSEGKDLLHANGVVTESLKPRPYYIPWITFNGVYNNKEMWEAQSNLKGVVCRYLGSSVPGC